MRNEFARPHSDLGQRNEFARPHSDLGQRNERGSFLIFIDKRQEAFDGFFLWDVFLYTDLLLVE